MHTWLLEPFWFPVVLLIPDIVHQDLKEERPRAPWGPLKMLPGPWTSVLLPVRPSFTDRFYTNSGILLFRGLLLMLIFSVASTECLSLPFLCGFPAGLFIFSKSVFPLRVSGQRDSQDLGTKMNCRGLSTIWRRMKRKTRLLCCSWLEFIWAR